MIRQVQKVLGLTMVIFTFIIVGSLYLQNKGYLSFHKLLLLNFGETISSGNNVLCAEIIMQLKDSNKEEKNKHLDYYIKVLKVGVGPFFHSKKKHPINDWLIMLVNLSPEKTDKKKQKIDPDKLVKLDAERCFVTTMNYMGDTLYPHMHWVLRIRNLPHYKYMTKDFFIDYFENHKNGGALFRQYMGQRQEYPEFFSRIFYKKIGPKSAELFSNYLSSQLHSKKDITQLIEFNVLFDYYFKSEEEHYYPTEIVNLFEKSKNDLYSNLPLAMQLKRFKKVNFPKKLGRFLKFTK